MPVIVGFKVKGEVVWELQRFSELFLMIANEFNKVKLLRLHCLACKKVFKKLADFRSKK